MWSKLFGRRRGASSDDPVQKAATAVPGDVHEAASSTPPDDPIQRIARAVLDAAHEPGGKVLLYSEAEEGVISADIFSQRSADEPVRHRFSPPALKYEIYDWRTETAEAHKGEWATMTLLIADGRFEIALKYPDQINPNEDVYERRPAVVAGHFGDAPVDYSNPR